MNMVRQPKASGSYSPERPTRPEPLTATLDIRGSLGLISRGFHAFELCSTGEDPTAHRLIGTLAGGTDP